MSQNEWETTEIRASKVGNFSPFSPQVLKICKAGLYVKNPWKKWVKPGALYNNDHLLSYCADPAEQDLPELGYGVKAGDAPATGTESEKEEADLVPAEYAADRDPSRVAMHDDYKYEDTFWCSVPSAITEGNFRFHYNDHYRGVDAILESWRPDAGVQLAFRAATTGSEFDNYDPDSTFRSCASRMKRQCGKHAPALLYVVAVHHLKPDAILDLEARAAKALACARAVPELANCLSEPLAGTYLHPNCAGDVVMNPAKQRAAARREELEHPKRHQRRQAQRKQRSRHRRHVSSGRAHDL